ncbi:hypothetical protein HJFPF1_13350 [Paramyrothecium foliicola]|nr:hypothetical protein HJFPF1_13350 [Paramyrothecium foliicola]
MPLPFSLSRASLAAMLMFSSLQTAAQDVCISQDQPNPIFGQYPNNATGALNTTLAIIPIPIAIARQIIPPQYAILVNAYRALIPDFPVDMYPAMVQAGHDHDIRFQNFSIPDFTRAGFEFPFLDILGDGSSSFRWAPEQMISADNLAAIEGSRAYGTKVHPSFFNPPCDAYNSLPGGETYLNGSSSNKFISLTMQRANANETFPYHISLFNNITNQPSFGNGSSCDQQIRLFNTSLTQCPFQPVPDSPTNQPRKHSPQSHVMFTKILASAVGLSFACLVAASAPPGMTCDLNEPSPCPEGLECKIMEWFSMGIATVGEFCIIPSEGTGEIPLETEPLKTSLTQPPKATPAKPTQGSESESPRTEYPWCGGNLRQPLNCDEGSSCMDDPRMESGCGMAYDLPGIYIPDSVSTYRGFQGLECPARITCYDDAKLDYDSEQGGADCPGVCL